MRFAPVAPISLLHAVFDKDPRLMSGYFLMLAHDVIEKPKEYADFINKLSGARIRSPYAKYPFIIMDNSLIELGEPVDTATMQEACRIVNAQVAVLPDVLGERIPTLIKIKQQYAEYKDIPDVQFMAIPQGRDLRDWVDCMDRISNMNLDRLSWWGVPKVLANSDFDRRARYKAIKILAKRHPRHSIHMLGFAEDYIRDMADIALLADSVPNLMGIDSAVPMRAPDFMTPIEEIGPRSEWWEQLESSEGPIEVPKHLLYNLRYTNSWVS